MVVIKTINYALIGCGRIAPNHIAAALYCENINIVALCDKDLSLAEKLKEEFSLKKVSLYKDYRQMIKTENIDLIAIATDSKSHAEIAFYAIEKEINLIIEKPIALSTEDANKIVSLSKEHGVIVSSCHQNRFNKAVLKLHEDIENKRLGKLFHLTANIRWNRGEDYYKQASWRGKWDSDGGALMNQCIHNIDLLYWLSGDEIAEVFAYVDNLNHPYIEAEDVGLALVKFKSGVYGVIEGTTNIYPQNFEETLSVFGEKGTIKLGGKSVNKLEEYLIEGENTPSDEIKNHYSEEPQNIYGFGHKALYQDVVKAVTLGEKPKVSAEDGARAVELILAIYQSSKMGKPVSLPLENISTADFKDSFKS